MAFSRHRLARSNGQQSVRHPRSRAARAARSAGLAGGPRLVLEATEAASTKNLRTERGDGRSDEIADERSVACQAKSHDTLFVNLLWLSMRFHSLAGACLLGQP